MIRVSTGGRYALRAMVDLAQHDGAQPVSRKDIAERQKISPDYAAQLFRPLQSVGLVEGIKGPGGGYRLARDPAKISAGDVVKAVEGPIEIVHCTLVQPGQVPSCDRVDCCITHQLWKRLSAVMTEFLDSVTLQSLCDGAQLLICREDNGGFVGILPEFEVSHREPAR